MDAAAQAAVGPGVMFSLPTFSGNVIRRSAAGKPKGVGSLFLTTKRLMRLFDAESLASVIVAPGQTENYPKSCNGSRPRFPPSAHDISMLPKKS